MFEVLRYCRNRSRILLYITPSIEKDYPRFYSNLRFLRQTVSLELKSFIDTVVPPIADQHISLHKKRFDHLLRKSSRVVHLLSVQHRILEYTILKNSFLYAILWKLSNIRLGLKLWFSYIFSFIRLNSLLSKIF